MQLWKSGLLVLAGGLWMLSAVAFANTPAEREFQRAVRLYDNLKFPQAYRLLQRYSGREGVTNKQRARAYVYQGLCLFYTKGPKAARVKFLIALRLDPKVAIPSQTPPPVQRLIALARVRLGLAPVTPRKRPRPKIQVKLSIQIVQPIQPGELITFAGTCTPHLPRAQLYVLLRRKGSKSYNASALDWSKGPKPNKCGGQVPNPIPATIKKPQRIEYLFQVRRGALVLQTEPPNKKPMSFTIRPHLNANQPKASGGSTAGVIVAITLATAAVIGGGVVLAYFLLNQPSGPSIDVSIDTTPGTGGTP